MRVRWTNRFSRKIFSLRIKVNGENVALWIKKKCFPHALGWFSHVFIHSCETAEPRERKVRRIFLATIFQCALSLELSHERASESDNIFYRIRDEFTFSSLYWNQFVSETRAWKTKIGVAPRQALCRAKSKRHIWPSEHYLIVWWSELCDNFNSTSNPFVVSFCQRASTARFSLETFSHLDFISLLR